MRLLQRCKQRFRLIHALLIFPLRSGIRNYAAAGLNVGHTVFHHHGAKRDAGIEIASEIEVENAAGIDSAARALHLFDDFHGAHFRCAGNGAGWKTSHQGVKTIHVFSQAAAEAGNQMHHMGVALDGEQLFGLHRAVIADAPEIVASKIDEHDVLGALLFACTHLMFEALVLGFILSAPTRARDRAVKDVASLNFDEHFRRTADDRDVVQLQVEKIGRRIQRAQLTINLERLGLRFGGEALAEYNLKNVPGANVLLRFLHGGEIFGPSEIGSHLQRAAFLGLRCLLWALGGYRLIEKPACLLDFAHGGVVFRAKAAAALGEHIANDPQTMLHVIERDQAVIEHQHRVVQADFIAEALGDALDQPDHVVTKVADGAGDERGQSGKPHGAKTLDAFTQERDGIALFPHDTVAALEHARAVGVAEDFLGVRSRKGVARDFLAAFHAFEKEGIPRALGNPQVGADRCQQIRGKNVIDRDKVALFRETLKFAEVRLDHRNKLTVPTESESSIDRFQFTKKETYYYITSSWPGLFVRDRRYSE